MFRWQKMLILTVLLVGFVCVQSQTASFAQDDSELYKKEALIEEELQKKQLEKLEEENPVEVSDEEMEKRQDELEASEKDLGEHFQEETEDSEKAVDDMLGVDDTDTDTDTRLPPVRRDRDEEENENIDRGLEDEPTRNSAFD